MNSDDQIPREQDAHDEAEAQRAAEGLREQIAKVRARVHRAKDELRRRAERQSGEPRSFKR